MSDRLGNNLSKQPACEPESLDQIWVSKEAPPQSHSLQAHSLQAQSMQREPATEKCVEISMPRPPSQAPHIETARLEPQAACAVELEPDCGLEQTVFTFNAAEYKKPAATQETAAACAQEQKTEPTPDRVRRPANGPLTIKSLNGKRYQGSVLDKLISWLADVIKIFELRMLGRLYSRRDARIAKKTVVKPPTRSREEEEIFMRAKRKRNKHRYPF